VKLLDVSALSAGYGQQTVFEGLQLSIDSGEVVGLVGPNGAGKTTLLQTLMGLHSAWSGSISLGGIEIVKWPAYKRAVSGLAMVTENKGLAPTLSARENLQLAKDYDPDGAVLAAVFEAMPKLKLQGDVRASDLSGGEQQFLAIARAVMMSPSLLLLDEPTLGLAPAVVDALASLLTSVASTGVSILVAEQNINFITSIAGRAYHMTHGRLAEADLAGLTTMADFLGSPAESDAPVSAAE
jgi:branched-chain amino acid transport system ATP-binding protein